MFLTFTWFTKLLCSLLCLLLVSALLSFIFFLLSIMRVGCSSPSGMNSGKNFRYTELHEPAHRSEISYWWRKRNGERVKQTSNFTDYRVGLSEINMAAPALFVCHVLFELPTLETRENHSWEFLEWMVSLSFLETSRDNVFLLKDAFIEIVPEAQKLRA